MLSPADIQAIAAEVVERLEPVLAAGQGARWLGLRVAADYARLGEKRLKDLAERGLIIGFQDPDSGRGDWIFDRLSLDAYRRGQIGSGGIRQRALDIIGSMRSL